MKNYEIKNKMYQVISLFIGGAFRTISKKSSIIVEMSAEEKTALEQSYRAVISIKEIL